MNNLNEIYKNIEKFEKKLKIALNQKSDLFNTKSLYTDFYWNNQFDLKLFCEEYLKSNTYPEIRLKDLIYYLFDLKIQIFYLLELDLGLYNHLIYSFFPHDSEEKVLKNPYFHLRKLSLDQNIILKSKILMERFYSFIFYLETGEHLENKKSKNKSKTNTFFKTIEITKWNYLIIYKDYFRYYDDFLRTPEAHKFSKLRGYFLNENEPDDISYLISGLINFIINNLKNIFFILKNENISLYWDISMKGFVNQEIIDEYLNKLNRNK